MYPVTRSLKYFWKCLWWTRWTKLGRLGYPGVCSRARVRGHEPQSLGGEVYGRGGATRRKQQQQWEGQGRKGAEEPAGALIPSSFPRPPARLAHLARPCNQPDYTPTTSDKVCVSWLKFLRSKSQLIHFVQWAGWFL